MTTTLKATVKLDGTEIVFEGPLSDVLEAIRQINGYKAAPPRAPRVFNEHVSENASASDTASSSATRQPRGENRERVYQVIADHFPTGGGRQAFIQRKFAEKYGTKIAVSSLRHALHQLDEAKRIMRRGDDWIVRPKPAGWQ